jgi:hypothetical protein
VNFPPDSRHIKFSCMSSTPLTYGRLASVDLPFFQSAASAKPFVYFDLISMFWAQVLFFDKGLHLTYMM